LKSVSLLGAVSFRISPSSERVEPTTSRHDTAERAMTTTTLNQRQPTPLSAGSGTEDPELPSKRSRKRKSTEKKLVPHSSTLHGLWGKPKPADDQPEAKGNGDSDLLDAKGGGGGIGGKGLLVFKVSPTKLAVAVQQHASERMVTPPRSLPDVIPQTPLQGEQEVPKTPSPRSSQKKRSFQQSPTDAVRRSPRNHQRESIATPVVDVPAKKPHPFFLGKEARSCFVCRANCRPSTASDVRTCPNCRNHCLRRRRAFTQTPKVVVRSTTYLRTCIPSPS
jgi:hypothetical protein